MIRSIFLVVLLAGALSASFCDAAVFQRDWKTPGDGLLTYDDVNQREWLDLSQTLLTSQFPGADREAKFQYVLGQTGSGGLFESFTAAKSADAIALAQSAGITTGTLNYAINHDPTLALQQLLNITYRPGTENNNTVSVGMLDERGNLSPPYRLAAILEVFFTNQAGFSIADPGQRLESNTPGGVMLFRATVPEPNAISIAAVALIMIMSSRRIRKCFNPSSCG